MSYIIKLIYQLILTWWSFKGSCTCN